MKNIFSKTTENRTQNGVKSYLCPTFVLYTISIFAFLTLGVGQMRAGNNIAFNNCHFYFNPYYDATNTVNKGYIQLSARKYQNSGGDDYGWWTATTTLSNVANTRLYYASTLEGTAWGDTGKRFHGWAIISNSDKKAASASDEWWNSSTWASDFKAYGLNSNNTYLFQASSSTKGKTIQTTSAPGYLSGGWSALNKTITVKAKVSTNNGSSYSEATSPGTLSASSNKFTAHNSCASATSLSSGTISCGYTATTTLTATDATGYDFVGWYNASGVQQTTNKELTIYPTDNATYYAYYKLKQYSVIFNMMGHGSAITGRTVNHGSTTTKPTDPTETGYIFDGWYTDKDCKVEYNFSSSITSDLELYAKWTKITITELSASPSYGTTGLKNMTVSFKTNVPRNAGYYYRIAEFGGAGTGTTGNGFHLNGQEINSGTAETLITTTSFPTIYFGTSGTYTSAVEIYISGIVQKRVTFTYTAGDYCTVSFDMQGRGDVVKPQNILSGNTATVPSPEPTATGYTFGGWYENPECTGSAFNFSTAITVSRTLYAKWTPKTTTVTLDQQSGTGGTANVTATYDAAMPAATMPKRDNYTFNGYFTGTEGSGTKYYNADGTSAKNWDIEDATKTLYAHWTEIKYEVTISVSNPSATTGTIDCSAAGWVASNHGTAQIGNATSVRIIAGAAASGYTWGSWVLSGGVELISGNLTDAEIVVKATSAGTATYTYAEDLSTTWYISGDGDGTGKDLTPGSPFSGWGTNGTRMYKKAGYSTVEKYYCTITVSTVATSNDHFPFQVFDGTNHRGYNGYWITKENNTQTVYTNNSNNMKFRPYITGDYEFEVDNTGANPVLTVHWPSINQLRVSVASPEDGSNIGNFDLTETSPNNWSVTRTLNANTTYTFKMVFDGAWYGNGTAFTRDNNSASGLGDGNHMTIQTDVAGEYTFTFNSNNKNLNITFPTAYRVTYGVGTGYTSPGRVSTSPNITSGDYVIAGTNITFTATPNLGYKFVGWYSNEACTGDAVSTDASYTIASLSTNTTLYAKFDYRPLYIHADFAPNGWDTPVQMTQSTENRAVYTYEIDPLAAKSETPASEGHHFHFVNTVENPNDHKAYNYKGVQTPTGSGFLTNKNIHLTDAGNPTIQFDLMRKSKITITLTLQSIDDNPKPTVHIAADPYYTVSTAKGGSGAAGITINPTSVEARSGANSGEIIATIDPGYTFTNWTADPSISINSPNDPTTTVRATGDGTLIANATPNHYAVHFDGNGNTGGSMQSLPALTYGVAFNLPANAFTKTGYTFAGWATSADGEVVYRDEEEVSNLTDVNNGTATLYAKWTPNKYTVTLDKQTSEEGYGGDEGTVANQTVTFDATLTTVSGSMPTAKNGWAFMGFYSATGGNGRCFIDPSGNWVTTAGDTIRDSKWVYDGNVTLYAYYKKAEITDLIFDAAVVAPGADVGVTPKVDPTPEGTYSICWKLLYNNGNLYTPQPTFSPANPGNVGNKVTFTAPSSSGMYLVAAVLRTGNECNGGTKLDSVTYPFQVAGDHTVTVQYKCGSEVIAPSTTVTGKPLEWTEVVAHDIFGYYFSGWTAGDGVTIEEAATGRLAELQAEDASIVAVIKMKAIYDGKLTANYSKRDYIYFKSTALGWNNVYVYFYTNNGYWNNDKGAGATGAACIGKGQMSLVPGETDIYYWDYGTGITGGPSAATKYVAFTWGDCTNHDNFYGNASSYPTNGNNQGFNAGTPMFVPISQEENYRKNENATPYYDRGYWTQYIGGTGYSIDIFHANGTYDKSINFEEGDSEGMPFTANVYLNGGSNLYFKVHRSSGMYYYSTTNVTMSNAATAMPLTYDSGASKKTTISTNVAGDYLFSLTCASDGKLNVTVKYPAKSGDYRLLYSDDIQTKPLASDVVHQENNSRDTVSFFVRPGSHPVLKIQKATVTDGGAITWSAGTDISSSLTSLTKDSVYNICLQMNESGAISVENVAFYTGNFYIRTDAANSKWDNYRAADHLMTYSEYSKDHSDYTHYFVKFVRKGTNVKFVVANDYSPCISDTLIRQTYRGGDSDHVDENGFLNGDLPGDGVNVRYMWDIRNNAVMRAYLAPAQSDGSNFLVLRGTDSDNLKDENGNPLRNASNSGQDGYNHKAPDYCIQFVDNENWIYEATVQVVPSSYVKLYAFFHGDNFYYKGTEDDRFDDTHAIKLVEGSGKAVKVRVIYDFKTDRLVAAYLPSGNIDEEMAINADVMFIREHQGDIKQLIFNGSGKITDIKTAYAVMRFNKWTLNNKDKDTHTPLASPASIYERSLYYVSFPFPVNLSEVFGFGTYGQHWIIQRYRGDLRAQQGFWAESAGFWEFIWNRNGVVLQPNEGYILTLETELLGEESDVWGPDQRSNQIELFFPSTGPLGSITNASVTQKLPKHTCTIDKTKDQFGNLTGLQDSPDPSTSYNRTVFDSHWNIMSVPTYVNVDDPSFANTTWIGGSEGNVGPKFLYTWNMNDNTLTATSGKGFMYHAMHAYTVQYYGNVTWKTSVTPPAAPQRNTEYRGEYEFCLEVQQDDQMIDRTYVRLSDDENVTTGFEFSEDMTKQFNSRKANIFTIAGNTSLGGNSLPLSTTQTTVVPVGVKIKTAGDYTFSIPEGTDGIGVTLVDNETGVRTLLSALDYTVNLTAGTHDGRFWLEISPIQNTPTGMEDPTSDSSLKGRAQKRIIDGVLYIVKDGKIFDARGTRVE